jgi:hypothetical protein
MKLFLVALMILIYPMQVVAQETKLDTCLRQMGNKVLPYDYADKNGAIGSYRLSVNDLFDAGFCLGKSPSLRSYQWSLCDFRGLGAQVSKVYNVESVIKNPEIQRLIMRQAFTQKFNRHLTTGNVFRDMAADIEASLIYTKGRAAAKLYKHTNIAIIDRQARSMRSYEALYQICADEKNPVIHHVSKPVTHDKQSIDHRDYKPADITWYPLNQMPEDSRIKILDFAPELRLVFGTNEKHVFSFLPRQTEWTYLIMRLSGSDFCTQGSCVYYIYDKDNNSMKTFYAKHVHQEWMSRGLYIDGFFKKMDEIGR